MDHNEILIEGARQNNLKDLCLRLPLHELIVVTGVSGSGKSSLAFDTVYSEGQRRYVETFSPYARQFLERMDKPQADRIEGIPPAIAIDQTNPVRTSRSTVGTMTELNDHLKLLFARAARLYCRGCGRAVAQDSPDSIYRRIADKAAADRVTAILIAFPVTVPDNFTGEEIRGWLDKQGYGRIHRDEGTRLEVIQDRLRLDRDDPDLRGRLVEDLEAALRLGQGRVLVYPLDRQRRPAGHPWRFSSGLHCPDCDIHYQAPIPSVFSFNSPIGACPACRGFGRIMGIDDALVIPDEGKTLAEGAVRPWQSPSYGECQRDLMRFAKRRGIPTDAPWHTLTAEQQRWVLDGEGDWDDGVWYGVHRFFQWLETKSYKMHIRVLLSKYRAYTPCPDCGGSRLKPAALWWRLGGHDDADAVLPAAGRFTPPGLDFPPERYRALPGLTLHDVMCLPLAHCRGFFERLHLPAPLDEATRAAAQGDPHAPGLPGGSGPGLPDPRPPVPDPERRRGPAHQPHHRPGHLPGQHLVRPGRAQHRPAPAGYAAGHRGAQAPARRGQLAAGGGARPPGDARRGPGTGPGPGARRARRRGGVFRPARRAAASRSLAHRPLPAGGRDGRRRP